MNERPHVSDLLEAELLDFERDRADDRDDAPHAAECEPPPPDRNHLPEIVISTDQEATVNAAEDALVRTGGVYVNARRLVHIVRDPGPPPDEEDCRKIRREAGTPLTARLKLRRLQEMCGSSAQWIGIRVTKKGTERRPSMVPAWVPQTLMERDQWKLPVLDGISDSPVFRRDGTICSTPGYDPRSRVFYDPRGVVFPSVPDAPTRGDAAAALAELLEPFVDFPFVDASSRSAVAALILTIVARSAISGSTPMFPINAREGGTGKGLAAKLVGIIATGRAPALTTHTHDDEELRKRFLALGLEAAAAVSIDNVAGTLGSAVLDAVLTAGELTDRLLGLSENRTVPIRFVLMATGNQIEYRADTARRIVPIDLDAKCERPGERSGPQQGTTWRHPDIERYARAERPRLLVAALTVLRAFAVAGRPRHGLPPMGSFEEWDALVRGALVFTGAADPCAGVSRLLESGADADAEQRRALVTSWHRVFGGLARTVAEVTAEVTKSEDPDRVALRDVLVGYCRDGKISNTQVGHALKKLNGRVIGELKLVAGDQDRNGSRRWQVQRTAGDAGDAGDAGVTSP